MRSRALLSALLASALLSTTGAAQTTRVGITAKKLIVLDALAAAGRAKTVFVSTDAGIAKAGGTDVNDIGAHVEIVYGSTRGSFVVPRGASVSGGPGWTANTDRVAKYQNDSAPDGPTTTKVAVVKLGRLLKLVARGLGENPLDVLNEGAPQDDVSVAYCVENGNDTTCHCTQFASSTCSWKPVAKGVGAKLTCRRGVGEASCSGTLPDLSGFWLFEQTGGSSTCVAIGVPSFETSINLVQTGAHLTGGGPIWSYEGTASVTDFRLTMSSIPPLLSCPAGSGVYEAILSIEGDLPVLGGVVPVTQVWTVFPLIFDPACPPCSVTWTGSMQLVFVP